MQKWNNKKRKYEDYKVPEGWYCPLYTEDMYKYINCCQCGKVLQVGDCYTSLEVHNHIGLGYGVCPECYEKEWERRREYKNL
jgi:hypothetical protein